MLNKHVLNKNKGVQSFSLNDKDFFIFLEKIIGVWNFQGKKSKSIKLFVKLLYFLKMKFRKDPYKVLWRSTNNLLPVLSCGYKRLGKRYHPIPRLAKGNKRFVLMIDWIFRRFKGSSHRIMGVDFKDFCNALKEAYFKKGIAIKRKKSFYKFALSGKHLLWNPKMLKEMAKQRKKRKKTGFKQSLKYKVYKDFKFFKKRKVF